MALADVANRYADEQALAAQNRKAACDPQAICSMGLTQFRVLMTKLKPVLPLLTERNGAFPEHRAGLMRWRSRWSTTKCKTPLKALYNRIEMKQVEALVEVLPDRKSHRRKS